MEGLGRGGGGEEAKAAEPGISSPGQTQNGHFWPKMGQNEPRILGTFAPPMCEFRVSSLLARGAAKVGHLWAAGLATCWVEDRAAYRPHAAPYKGAAWWFISPWSLGWSGSVEIGASNTGFSADFGQKCSFDGFWR